MPPLDLVRVKHIRKGIFVIRTHQQSVEVCRSNASVVKIVTLNMIKFPLKLRRMQC